MLARLTPKEKLAYTGLGALVLFGLSYVGVQRLKAPVPLSIRSQPQLVPPDSAPVVAASQISQPPAKAKARKGGKVAPPLGSVDINKASLEELEQIPGIGPATSSRIVELRTQKGKLASIDELHEIRGLNGKRFDRIRIYFREIKASGK